MCAPLGLPVQQHIIKDASTPSVVFPNAICLVSFTASSPYTYTAISMVNAESRFITEYDTSPLVCDPTRHVPGPIAYILYTDKSVVASAPTGSGKTVLFELALIRLLTKPDFPELRRKIVYMAPMKALCSERYIDWNKKFGNFGVNCLELTGDSELEDVTELFNANLICTTPEKWDSMSRRWKDNKILFQQIQLFLIDEIHILNDPHRGATVEAVVSRMKTLETAQELVHAAHIRFIAVSATMPNYKDIAEWLGTPSKPASAFK
ncbi:activating signal cointegrator 1 complex subunit 3 [Elysia marginata]|uniref:Activating signal cointegrator 1 complex subunit 3 n=1 Tax=Elysia marginata TaxID=1093978 RepID=A0AAV4IJE2_9GAST|nr:activating signal cointegrator 1 complex subunit 3 [Elysia marginata]